MPDRCAWCGTDPLYTAYHDLEWGVPNHDDRHLFEMLVLEGAQAGLSWITILKKRENYRRAFDDFDAEFPGIRRGDLANLRAGRLYHAQIVRAEVGPHIGGHDGFFGLGGFLCGHAPTETPRPGASMALSSPALFPFPCPE